MRLPGFLNTVLDSVARIGADPADDEEARLRKALLVLIALLILPISLVWWLLYLAFGSWTGWFAFVYFVISVASIVLFARNRNTELFMRVQLLSILLLPTISMIWLGGVLPAGGVGLWAILAPLGALVFRGVASGVRWYVAFLAIFVTCGVAGSVLDVATAVPEWFSTLMLLLNVAVGGTIVFTLLALFAQQRRGERPHRQALAGALGPGEHVRMARLGERSGQESGGVLLAGDVSDHLRKPGHHVVGHHVLGLRVVVSSPDPSVMWSLRLPVP